MKRKNIYIVSFLSLALGLGSCSDSFLELEPKTGQIESTYYKTEAQAKAAVAAVYDSYQNIYACDVLGMSDAFSDDAFAGGANPNDLRHYVYSENGAFDGESDNVSGVWKRCYAGIYRADLYLSKQDGVEFTTTGLKAQLEAEAYFLRGYMYWDLVRHYGWAPITNTVLPYAEDYKSIPQSTPTQLYNQVASDLLKALPALPEVAETGRISKAACQALIARIYLYHTGISQIAGLGLTPNTMTDGVQVIDQTFVKEQLSQIIASGKYRVLPNYVDVFAWDNQNNDEMILCMQYSNEGRSGWGNVNQVNGNMFTQRCGVRDPDPATFTDHGWSGCTITWDLVNVYGSDPRKNVTVFDAASELSSYTKAYMNTGYFNRKYMPQTSYKTTLGGDAVLNWPINLIDIRYADVLLMAAELDVDAKGLDYFNEVHFRAVGANITGPLTQDIIYNERRLEFGGEGLRKWDMLRRGLDYAKQCATASFTNIPANVPNPGDFTGRNYAVLDESWGMMPVPAVEIRNANIGVLVQHVPYYIGK